MLGDNLNAIFRTTTRVRIDDLDVNGHVRGPALLAYADDARWACLRAAGIDLSDLLARRVGPVNLETTIRFHHELRPGAEVVVSCVFEYGSGKTTRVRQELRTADGELVAEVTSVSGLLDLDRRRLVPDPGDHWRAIATSPAVLGL